MQTPMAKANSMPKTMAFLARSSRFAPTFWEMKELMDCIRDEGTSMTKETILLEAEPAEDGGNDVICDDEKYTGAADPDIGRRQINRLFRRLHEHGNRLCENDHDKAENGTDHGKQADRRHRTWPAERAIRKSGA